MPHIAAPCMRVLTLTLTLPMLALGAREPQTPGGVQPQAAPDTAARIERVLKGLRPRIEVEGAPVRWTLAERMTAYKVPAVTLAIIDGGRLVWAQGFGLTEIGGQDPVTATTLFQAGSISKAITVSAMLRLVDKGTLSLDTNVNTYLTSWKLPENDFTRQQPVTLRRLATHTGGTTVSGFPGYKVGVPRPTVPELLDGKAPANTPPVRVDTLPGQAFRYSGGGTTIIQQVLTDVTGTPFPALLQQQVLGPLGMAHSSFDQPLTAARAAAAAHGHVKGAIVPGGWHVYPELAAAGLWTTPTDLAAWATGMADALGGRSTTFLSQPTAAQILGSAVPGRSAQERVGLGLFFNGSEDLLSFNHGGEDEGFVSNVKMYPKTGQGVVIMVNAASGVGLFQEIELAIQAEFGWPEVGTTRITAVAVEPAVLDRLTGTYVLYNLAGRHYPRVVREGTRLYYEFGDVRKEMYPQSPTTFIGTDGSRFSFARDDGGRYVVILGTGASAVAAVKQ